MSHTLEGEIPMCHHDYWNNPSIRNSIVQVICFMPNSFTTIVSVSTNISFSELKEEIWEEATKWPLYGLLRDLSNYSITYINSLAKHEVIIDENKRLCDVKPFLAVLNIVERQQDEEENILNAKISSLIGKNVSEFDSLNSLEVNQFRKKMKVLADQIRDDLQRKSWLEQFLYQYPQRLAASMLSSNVLPATVTRRLRNDHFSIVIKFDSKETIFTFNVSLTTTPDQLLMQIIKKRALTLKTKNEVCSDFILKVCGREEYIVGLHALIDFAYVQDSLSQNLNPTLAAVSKFNVPVSEKVDANQSDFLEKNKTCTTSKQRNKNKYNLSFDINEPFKFKVNYVRILNYDVSKPVEFGIEASLFHGGKALCECVKTSKMTVENNNCMWWNEELIFNISVANIPRMARLCLVVYEIPKTSKIARRYKVSKQQIFVTPVAWVNTTVYDFKNQFRSGKITLYMWKCNKDLRNKDLLNPLGTVVSNPKFKHPVALMGTFHSYRPKQRIVYPSFDQLQKYAAQKEKQDLDDKSTENTQLIIDYIDKIKTMTDEGKPLDVKDKKKLWRYRYHVLQSVPALLAKLLDCVEWGMRWEVAEVTSLVSKWPLLEPHKALELLDFAHADQFIRSFAVKCLQTLSDQDLLLLFLQLVQALKHECYLYCDLVEFLITRALRNQKIGHYLFWHLRSEMQDASVSVRFGLMLEAYCRGSIEHMKTLSKQVDLLEKLKKTTEIIQKCSTKEKIRSSLHKYFQEEECVEAMSSVHSPLDPSYKCKRVRKTLTIPLACAWVMQGMQLHSLQFIRGLKIDKCRVMDSKMKPLWIVFENEDIHGDDIQVIFKNGDDLRQDMFILQMFAIIDKLWKNYGLDLRMNVYQCLSTDSRAGMIEVVLNAETIANIQKERARISATSAFHKELLLEWLKENNQTEQSFQNAIEEFTYSCAGYCVATYVLGIADRHSDNIMIKKTGQLFHIDFGHILGNFKEKFGVRRERTPFVLTHDFVHVICKGKTKKESQEFEIFQKCCEKAFLILRRHGTLILSLFVTMTSTLPELATEKDLEYLRNTLALELSEEGAVEKFRSKFYESLRNSWKTSFNWMSHNLARDNK